METDRSHTFRTDQANIARHTPDLNLRDEGERGRPATTQRRTGTEVKTIHTPGAGILETEIETIYTSALDRSKLDNCRGDRDQDHLHVSPGPQQLEDCREGLCSRGGKQEKSYHCSGISCTSGPFWSISKLTKPCSAHSKHLHKKNCTNALTYQTKMHAYINNMRESE